MELKLYEIAEAIKKIEDIADDEQELATYLDSVQMQLKEKAENVIRFRQSLIMGADAIKNEIERLSRLQNGLLRRANNIEAYISHVMVKNDITQIQTDIAKLSFRKSEAVILVDESQIPDEYKKQVITNKVDKTAIKEAIKGGKQVPGAELEQRKNLQIK